MMICKIWQKYFIKQTLYTFVLILFCFYGIYFLIDYSSRAGSQQHHHAQFPFYELLYFYLFEFVQRLDVIVPFALMVATIRTLIQLNTQNELIALLASGVKMKTLLRPFVLLALLCTTLIYINYQYVIPHALKEMRHINDAHAFLKKKKQKKLTVQNVALKDRSVLLFQEYDPFTETFFDVYWVKSFDEIYHMKYLSPVSRPPLGYYVDHLVRNSFGIIEKTFSFQTKEFPEIHFNRKVLLDTITPPEELSLSNLWQQLPPKGIISSEKEAQMMTTFYQKVAMPWLCLLAVLGPAPLCVRFSRNFPVFLIYSVCIFGLAAFYIAMDAAAVLGGRQVLPPPAAIMPPFLFFMSISLFNYFKL